MARQIVLDTETTGLELARGHRVIEIGCVELNHRRLTGNTFHHYLNPERDIDVAALGVHGIRREFLADKPRFTDIAGGLLDYLRGAELIIHNAEFDVGFLDAELSRAGRQDRIGTLCTVTDTLYLARQLHPGQKNSLNALCRRYGVDDSNRELHGALLDASLLADVYLAMTGGQEKLLLESLAPAVSESRVHRVEIVDGGGELRVVQATKTELTAHRERLQAIAKKTGRVLWQDDLLPQGDTPKP